MNIAGLDGLFARAENNALEAAKNIIPMPMIVQERANPLDDNSPVVHEYEPVMGGVCGFAWIVFSPGNSKIANFAKKRYGSDKPNNPIFERNETDKARALNISAVHRNYGGGVAVWIHGYGQSMTRKEAFARAFVQTFLDAGFTGLYAQSRMD